MQRLSAQVNEILHHPKVQTLESAWRGLKFLIDRTDFRENIKVEMLNATKEDLLTDFEDAPETVKSGLYRLVYSNEYGVFGGKPYGADLRQLRLRPRARRTSRCCRSAPRWRPCLTRPSSPTPRRSSSVRRRS